MAIGKWTVVIKIKLEKVCYNNLQSRKNPYLNWFPRTNLDSSSADMFTVITLDGPINLVSNLSKATLKIVLNSDTWNLDMKRRSRVRNVFPGRKYVRFITICCGLMEFPVTTNSMATVSRQSKLVSFYSIPSGKGEMKVLIVHWKGKVKVIVMSTVKIEEFPKLLYERIKWTNFVGPTGTCNSLMSRFKKSSNHKQL